MIKSVIVIPEESKKAGTHATKEDADKFVPTPFGDSENSVVVV